MGDKLHELISSLKELASNLGRTPTSREFIKSGHSHRQITNHGGYNNLVIKAGLEVNKSGFNPSLVIKTHPIICYLDEEVSDMLVRTYSLKNDYIHHSKIVKNWHFLSYAAVLEHEPETFYYMDQRFASNIEDDRPIVEAIHHIVSRSHILSGHNLKKFDLKKFNTRAALYGLPPIGKKIIWDTLPLFKRYFDLPSYSLAFIAKYFGFKYQKLEHSSDMWERCKKGELEAWQENEKYNKMDVLCQREALHFIAKFEPSINIQIFHQERKCFCGSTEFIKLDIEYSKSSAKQTYKCLGCSKIYTSKDNLVDKDIRKSLLN